MLRRFGSHVRNQWMGALSLFLVLAGGTAYAVDTVGSSDVINESLLSEDIRNGTLRTGDLGANSVLSTDVRDDTLASGGLLAEDLASESVGRSELNPLAFAAPDISRDSPTSAFEVSDNAIQSTEVSDGTLSGADIASNSLTGLDINESSLSGFDGHDAYRDLCDTPSDNSFRDCLSVTFTLGQPMEVLAIFGGGGSHGSYGYSDRAVGECKTKLDGVDRLNPVEMVNENSTAAGMATIIDVISLAAGSHTVTLACRENPSDLEFEDLTIGVVELGFD